MKRAPVLAVVVLAVVVLPHTTDAGKKKKAEAFTLTAHGSHATRAGVTLSLEVTGSGTREDGSGMEAWALRASDGADTAEVTLSSEEPWAELAAFDRLYQAVPSGGGVKVTVKALPKAQLEDDALTAKVTAQADKLRIHYRGVGFVPIGGVARVVLGDGGSWPVIAHVGLVSGAILDFDVDPYATITPGLPAKAVTGVVSTDGVATTVGGVTATMTMDDQAYTLTVRKGKKRKTAESDRFAGKMFELVALSKLIWVRGDELIVAPAKKLAKRAISDEKAIAIVQAEAARRGITYDGSGAFAGSGVTFVELQQGSTVVVYAVVGKRSKQFLQFDVNANGVVEQQQVEAPPDREPEPIASSNGMQTILDEHNRYRAAHCAPALTWSDKLAAVAQKWAETLRDASCGFEHSQGDYGENLAAGSTGYLPPEEVVGMWYREIGDYDFKNGGFSMSTGHFTQVVWKSTKQVGCGMVTDCDGMDIWVCNYDPAGNWEGRYEKNVLPTSCK